MGVHDTGWCTGKTAIPATTNCTWSSSSNQCEVRGYWNVTNTGSATKITISNPSLNNSNAYWTRYMLLEASGGYPRIYMGIENTKGTGFGDFCSGSGYHPAYMLYHLDANKFPDFKYCQPVDSRDVNSDAFVQVSTDIRSSCWPMLVFNFTAGHSQLSGCVEGSGSDPVYVQLNMWERVTDNVNGHEVWGSKWNLNQYEDAGGTFHYFTRNFDGFGWGGHAQPPPQMFWHTVPASGNNGGTLYSCVYDSTANSCTPGS